MHLVGFTIEIVYGLLYTVALISYLFNVWCIADAYYFQLCYTYIKFIAQLPLPLLVT